MSDIREILAANLAQLMERSADCKSQNALAKRSGIAQTTIGNYLNANYAGYPNLEKVEKLAKCFSLEAWNLLHPTIGDRDLSAKEIQMYRKWREDVKKLQSV